MKSAAARSGLKAALRGAATGRELGLALSRYCGADGYLRALKAGAPRIGLDGQPAGEVDLVDAAHAEMCLDLRRRKRRARQASSRALAPAPVPSPARSPAPPPPRRTSLADLRAAAAAGVLTNVNRFRRRQRAVVGRKTDG
jgi:ProP effector